MSTWLGIVIETGGRGDFWQHTRAHGIEPTSDAVPARAFVDCGHADDHSRCSAIRACAVAKKKGCSDSSSLHPKTSTTVRP